MKRCSVCQAEKPIEDFHRDKSRSDGRQRTCKECTAARGPKYRGFRVVLEKFMRCTVCGQVKRYGTDFYVRRYRAECRACRDAKARNFATARRQLNRELKLMIGCVDCGYLGDASKLQWDHLPGHVKLFDISRDCHVALERVEAELAKCEVVCEVCHTRRSIERGQLTGRPPRRKEYGGEAAAS